MLKNRLPFCTLWGSILLGDLQRFSSNYPTRVSPHSAITKNIFVDNMTNATSENIYTTLKRDESQLRLPITDFISRVWNFTMGHSRHWVDGFYAGEKDEAEAKDVRQKKL